MKKHNASNYHAVREAVAADIFRVRKEDGETNLADILMKVIVGQKRLDFFFHFVVVEVAGPTQPRVLTDGSRCQVNLQGSSEELVAS
jgi:hypothetical protein